MGGVGLLRSLATTPTRIDLAYGGSGLSFPRLNDITIDGWALAFIAATSLLTVLVFGMAPAFRCSWSATGLALRSGTRSTALGFAGIRLRAVLVVAEVGAALILLAGWGLLILSFFNLSVVDAGSNPERVLTFQVSLP